MKDPINRPNRDLVIISDIHLGADHCQKQELLEYFKTIRPQKLVFIGKFLEGEYIEIIQEDTFCSRIFRILQAWIQDGTQIYFMGKIKPDILATLLMVDKSKLICKPRLEFRIDHKIFHIISHEHLSSNNLPFGELNQNGKFLIDVINKISDKIYKFFSSKRRDIGRLVINSNGKLNLLNNYFNRIENNSVIYAGKNDLDGIITGLMQEPKISKHSYNDRKIMYINTGDWNSSLSALEYTNGKWEFHLHEEHFFAFSLPRLKVIR